MAALVIGLGNPILGDDGVGWRVADAVETRLRGNADGVEVDRSSAGGLALMERLVGYERAVVVDAIRGGGSAGDVRRFALDDLPDPGEGHTGSPHDATLRGAFDLGLALGADLPRDVTVVAVVIPESLVFSESLSPPVAGAVPRAVDLVLQTLGSNAEPRGRSDSGQMI